MLKKILIYAVTLIFVYTLLSVLFAAGYFMTWFVEMRQPSLNVYEWSELGRFLLAGYLVIVAPMLSWGIIKILKG